MKLTDAVKKAVSQIASLVFVPRCASCYKVLPSKRIPLCEKCKSAYLLESKKLCKKCGRVHKMCVCRIKIGGTNVPFVHVTGYDVNRSSGCISEYPLIAFSNLVSLSSFFCALTLLFENSGTNGAPERSEIRIANCSD